MERENGNSALLVFQQGILRRPVALPPLLYPIGIGLPAVVEGHRQCTSVGLTGSCSPKCPKDHCNNHLQEEQDTPLLPAMVLLLQKPIFVAVNLLRLLGPARSRSGRFRPYRFLLAVGPASVLA